MARGKNTRAKATTGTRKAKRKSKSSARTSRRLRATGRRAATAPRRKDRVKTRPAQRFVVSHHREEDFAAGLRRYAKYRDLGIAAATGGLVQAHVIRFVPPCRPDEVSKRHYHDVEFQMVYVLKGSITADFEGQGPVTMRQGSAWIQPPRIKHAVLDYSDDCEVLEIVLPADFKTVELE